MLLIENTNKDNFQSYLSCNKTEGVNPLVSKLILSNIMHRFLNDIKDKISPREYVEQLAPKLKFKLVKLTPIEGDKEVYVGNLNQKGDINKPDNFISNPKVEQLFRESGVNLPSDRVLSSRLEEINYSDDDPIRLSNIDYNLELELNLSELSYSDIEDLSTEFEDHLYSNGYGLSPGDEYKAIYILSISKHVPRPAWKKLNSEDIKGIVETVEDTKIRQEVATHLTKFLKSSTQDQDRIIEEADRLMSNKKSQEVNQGNSKPPIKTWKVILIASIAILGTLAYLNRESIKNSWELSKDYTSDTPSVNRFGLFVRLLLSKKGRANSKSYMEGRKNSELAFKTLEEEKARMAHANYLKETGSLAMNRAKKFIDGII